MRLMAWADQVRQECLSRLYFLEASKTSKLELCERWGTVKPIPYSINNKIRLYPWNPSVLFAVASRIYQPRNKTKRYGRVEPF